MWCGAGVQPGACWTGLQRAQGLKGVLVWVGAHAGRRRMVCKAAVPTRAHCSDTVGPLAAPLPHACPAYRTCAPVMCWCQCHSAAQYTTGTKISQQLQLQPAPAAAAAIAGVPRCVGCRVLCRPRPTAPTAPGSSKWRSRCVKGSDCTFDPSLPHIVTAGNSSGESDSHSHGQSHCCC